MVRAIKSELSYETGATPVTFLLCDRCLAMFVGEEEVWNEYPALAADGVFFQFGGYYDGACRLEEFSKNPLAIFDLPAFRSADREVRLFFGVDFPIPRPTGSIFAPSRDFARVLGVWCILISYSKSEDCFRISKFASDRYLTTRKLVNSAK